MVLLFYFSDNADYRSKRYLYGVNPCLKRSYLRVSHKVGPERLILMLPLTESQDQSTLRLNDSHEKETVTQS